MINFKITSHKNFQIKSIEEYYGDNLICKTIWNDLGDKIYFKDAKIEANYLNNKLHGKCKYFHDNGILAHEAFYVNDKPVGEAINYHENSLVSQIANYDENGLLQGKLKAWDSNGELYRETFYQNNKPLFNNFF